MGFPEVKISLDTSKDDLRAELYSPCLKWADRFDRGVGFFTSGWLNYNLAGMSDFASRGGRMRLITSPILSNDDTDAIICSNEQDASSYERLEAALLNGVDTLQAEMQKDIFNAFSWMLHDGIIELKFAIPCKKLNEGIDISTVTNIFLFASDRSRLVTTQRIGRALRLDKNNPDKVANVIDFVLEDKSEGDTNADTERKEWLTELAKTRRIVENEK